MDLFKRVVLAFFCCQTRKFLNKVKYKIRKRDGELWDHSRQTGIHHCNQSHEQRATNELVIGCEGNETDLDNGEPFQSKSHQNLYPSTIVSLNAFYQQECASNLSNIASKNITKKKHKKKTKHNKKNNTCKDTQCIWGGGAAPSPPTLLQPLFFKVASSHCHIASKNTTKKKHKKKKTKMTEKKQHMQRHPKHLAAPPRQKMTEKKHKCKDAQCIFRRKRQKETTNAKTPDASGGEAPLTHTSRRK